MKNIIISDKEKLKEKIKNISEEGRENFHVVADFDRTLTKAFVKGQKSSTVIAQIRNGNYLTSDYAPKAHELFNKYNPIEINPNLSMNEKIPHMNKWWREHFDLLIEKGMNKQVIEDIIKKGELKFREGALDFIDYLYEENIPLLIMSAGPGDMIKRYLENENKKYNNVHIIANFFKWNKNGKAIGIKEPIIHVMNKDEVSIKGLPVYNQLLKRKNILLLGDSLGDLKMAEGFPYNEIIKIGFLNHKVNENLKSYKKGYDIIIMGDGDMEYANNLLKSTFKQTS